MKNWYIEQEFKDIKPAMKQTVMDLVSEAGIDTSDWKNYKGRHAASNPKYCYNWSFEYSKDDVIVINLWYDRLELKQGKILCEFNPKKFRSDNVRRQRVEHLNKSLAKAFTHRIPLRVILLGKKDGSNKPDFRSLDTKYWYVHKYDEHGNCIVIRDESKQTFIDQFTLNESEAKLADKIKSTINVHRRSKVVRELALLRAQGRCEFCNEEGFKTASGAIYLESHHIQPLSEGGEDNIENVIALCPNHHREAHYSEQALKLREEFFNNISKKASWGESEFD